MTLQTRINKAQNGRLRISTISLGERRRSQRGTLKDLKSLQDSMLEIGLIHPILVSTNGLLITGRRRLQAAESLGWSSIPARQIEVTEDELRAIELDENECRSDLDAFEASEQRLQEIKEIEDVLTEKEKRKQELGPYSSRARQFSRRIRKQAEDASGVHRQTIHRDRRIVSAVKQYPYMQHWSQRPILDANARLENMGKIAKQRIAAVMNALNEEFGPKAATEHAVAIIENYNLIAEPVYRKLAERAKSKDKKQRTRAITDAIRLPPVPDEREGFLVEALTILKRVAKVSRRDEAHDYVVDARACVEKAIKILQTGYNEERREFERSIMKQK